jgi:hypothetical protein
MMMAMCRGISPRFFRSDWAFASLAATSPDLFATVDPLSRKKNPHIRDAGVAGMPDERDAQVSTLRKVPSN